MITYSFNLKYWKLDEWTKGECNDLTKSDWQEISTTFNYQLAIPDLYDSFEIAITAALNNHFVEYIVEYDSKFTLRLEL